LSLTESGQFVPPLGVDQLRLDGVEVLALLGVMSAVR
jgi:hypothetical protein